MNPTIEALAARVAEPGPHSERRVEVVGLEELMQRWLNGDDIVDLLGRAGNAVRAPDGEQA